MLYATFLSFPNNLTTDKKKNPVYKHLPTTPILLFKKLNSDNSFQFHVVTLRISVDLMLGGMQLGD